MNAFKVSLVISFYNKIEYLKLILAALERQSMKDFEVIIADDGSREAVVTEIRDIMTTSPLSIQHAWHEDIGFRKTKILNESIRRSRSNYLVFIDGDCVPHFRFIEEHYLNRETNTLLAGRRANLSDKLSKKLTVEKIRGGYLEKGFVWDMLIDGMMGDSNHVIKGIFVGNRVLRRVLNRSVKGVLGCNFSIHRDDLLAINGFDERYQAPAVGEDSDIEVRLLWNNTKIKMVKNMAVQYHIYHPKLSRPSENQDLFKKVKEEKKAYTPYGVFQTNPQER